MDPEFVSEFYASLLYLKKKNNGVDLPAYPHSLSMSSTFANSFLESISAKTYYDRCSKILNTSCLPKRARQTVQTQIRLSLIRVFFVCYSDKLFCEFSLGNLHFIWNRSCCFIAVVVFLFCFFGKVLELCILVSIPGIVFQMEWASSLRKRKS